MIKWYNMYLLKGFDLFTPSSWTTDQTSAFWTAFGAIGTLGALLYLVIKDFKNRKHITDLSGIVESLTAQLEIQKLSLRNEALPDLQYSIEQISQTGFNVQISNIGHTATISKINCNSHIISLSNVSPPHKIRNGSHKTFSCKTADSSPIVNKMFALTIEYHDKINNRYRQIVQCNGTALDKPIHTEFVD